MNALQLLLLFCVEIMDSFMLVFLGGSFYNTLPSTTRSSRFSHWVGGCILHFFFFSGAPSEILPYLFPGRQYDR